MKTIRKTIYTALLLLSLTVGARAQGTAPLTLDDCLREALAHNVRLRNADNDIRMADQQRREAFTKYFPTVSASGLGLTANEHLLKMDMGGAELALVKHGVTASVTAMQPLFAGGQIVNGNRLAQVGLEASRLQRAMTENEVALNTETYFWQIVMLQEKLKTVTRVEAQVERMHRDAEAAVEAGVRNRNDLLQVQLRSNATRQTRIELEHNLLVLTDLLSQYIGHMGDSLAVVSPLTGRDSLPEDPSALYVEPETALQQTHEYQLLGRQVDAERLQYRLAVGKNLPTLAVGGGYVYNHLLDRSENRLVGMVSLSVPISGWWGGSHSMRRQKIRVESAENDRSDRSQQLVIRMRKAWYGVSDAYKQVRIALESIAQSEENLRLHDDYYRAGTDTMSELLDAQTLYQQACDAYVEAYTQYAVKRREYLQATGR